MPRLTTEAKRLRPLIFAAAEASQAAMAVRIIVYHRDGAPAEYFPVTDAGWDLAAAACREYDTMVSPPAQFDQAHTVPNNVMYIGAGDLSTEHIAPLTLGNGCYLYNLQVKINADSADDIVALYGNTAGKSWTNTINAVVNQAGSGNATAFVDQGGLLNIYDTYLFASTSGAGMAIAAQVEADGVVMLWNCETHAETLAGSAYGVYRTLGTVYLIGGECLGTTAPFYNDLGE